MPHVSGMELLQAIKTDFPDVECIIITAIDDIDTAVNAMRYGAYDYMVKPLETGQVLTLASTGTSLPRAVLKASPAETVLSLREMERQYIQRVLEAKNGNRTQAAMVLGIGLRTLQRKLKIV